MHHFAEKTVLSTSKEVDKTKKSIKSSIFLIKKVFIFREPQKSLYIYIYLNILRGRNRVDPGIVSLVKSMLGYIYVPTRAPVVLGGTTSRLSSTLVFASSPPMVCSLSVDTVLMGKAWIATIGYREYSGEIPPQIGENHDFWHYMAVWLDPTHGKCSCAYFKISILTCKKVVFFWKCTILLKKQFCLPLKR